jgi:hypothetical protein
MQAEVLFYSGLAGLAIPVGAALAALALVLVTEGLGQRLVPPAYAPACATRHSGNRARRKRATHNIDK